MLSAARRRRTTLVVAGAGYGKTTALAEATAAGPSRWVRLRPANAQAESLAARIAGALAALLCELAGALEDDLLLVIDGPEYIGDDDAASHLLRVLSLEAVGSGRHAADQRDRDRRHDQVGTVGSTAITYSGTVSGSSMSGRYQVHNGGAAGEPWSASKKS